LQAQRRARSKGKAQKIKTSNKAELGMAKQAEEQTVLESSTSTTKRRIRVGIVGCGEATQIIHWLSLYQLSDRYEVTALCDISVPVVEKLGESWNIANLTTDHRELVTRSDVDAVLIATPDAFHAEVTLDAIAAGKHVLVEKPMCVTCREADQIIATRKNSSVVVQVGYVRRYAPAFLDGYEIVKKMKEIKFARVRDFIGHNSLIVSRTSRVVRDEQLPELIKKEGQDRKNALLDEALGEGSAPAIRKAYSLLLGLSSHDLSAMREWLGMPNKVLFAAQRGNGLYLTAAFDYGAFVCAFETGVDDIPRFDAQLEVYGTDKIVRIQYDSAHIRNLPIRLIVTESNGRGGVNALNSHLAWGDPFVSEWKAFYENIVQNSVPKTSPADFAQDLELFGEMVRLMHE
jgi:predicted dehydrogenase